MAAVVLVAVVGLAAEKVGGVGKAVETEKKALAAVLRLSEW